MKHLRRYLVAGILFWVPVGVTIFLLRLLVDLMDRTLLLLPEAYRPETLLGFNIPGLGILLTLVVLLGTGVLAANYLGRQFVQGWESLLNRIPLVRSIYSSAKQVAETLFSDTSQSFKRVLLIEYPRKGLWGLAFLTATSLAEVQARSKEELICVFVPTTPNPTSGFLIMVPRNEVIELDMDVEQALKMIISLGVVIPPWTPPEGIAIHRDSA